MAKRKNYTKKADRIKLYIEQIEKLRMATICCNSEMYSEAADMLVRLNRRFEREDNPKCL
jgi:hypothetical protein